jgi:hypothetical protein
MAPVMLPLNVVGVQLLPWCYDNLGSYDPGLRIFLGALVAASALLMLLRPPERAGDSR